MPLILTERKISEPHTAARPVENEAVKSITMKAMKDFRGQPGEGNARIVETGNEFTVQHQSRADYLEREGLAYPIGKAEKPAMNKMEQAPQNKADSVPQNKAADAGPLASVGGETGEETALSLSDQVRQPQRRRSRKPSDGLDL